MRSTWEHFDGAASTRRCIAGEIAREIDPRGFRASDPSAGRPTHYDQNVIFDSAAGRGWIMVSAEGLPGPATSRKSAIWRTGCVSADHAPDQEKQSFAEFAFWKRR